MGFQECAVGYIVQSHEDTNYGEIEEGKEGELYPYEGFLLLCCSHVVYNNKRYDIKNETERKEFLKRVDDDDEWDFFDNYIHGCMTTRKSENMQLEFYDDITPDLNYKHEPDIYISQRNCAIMICVMDYGLYDDEYDYVEEDVLQKLFEWKKELVKQGRLRDSPLCLYHNCCS